jgi:hypothetical protein
MVDDIMMSLRTLLVGLGALVQQLDTVDRKFGQRLNNSSNGRLHFDI